MNYPLLILVAISGILIGSYFGVRKKDPKATLGRGGLIFGQSKKKQENKERILEFLKSNPNPSDGQVRKITNNDVEKICKVSHATAERYLDQLEKDGKLTQHGKIGTDVFYTLK